MSSNERNGDASDIEIQGKEGELESSEGEELTKGGGESEGGSGGITEDEEENCGESLTRVMECSSLSRGEDDRS